MGHANGTSPVGHGMKALGAIESGASLPAAIRTSRLERQRFHAYLAYRVARAERASSRAAATAA